MDLGQFASQAYPQLWDFITYAASQKDEAGSYKFSPFDLSPAIREIGQLEGRTFAFGVYTGAAQLFGVARTMERAADTLTAADDQASLDEASHVSEPPWSRSQAQMEASPEWQLRAEITYRAPDGSIITTWGTGIFQRVLPSTVGAMRDEAWLQFQRMLSKRSEQRNTGGELLSIGRQYLMAV